VTLAHPLGDGSSVRRVAKHPVPPQFCFRPSMSGVKNFSHFALSGRAHGSRLK
jgi:hypothetical protein